MKNEIKMNELSLETLTEIAKESFDECSGVFQLIVENENRLAKFGEVLAACRAKVPHGKWSEWVQETFAGRLTIRTAQRWIIEAVDPEKAEALRIKDRQAKAAKSKASDLSHPKPGVEVIEPDAGLNSEPTTNTKHTAENRKANPAEQPATQPVNVQAELVRLGDIVDEKLEMLAPFSEAIEKTKDGRHIIDVLGEESPDQLLESCFRHNAITAIVRFLINSTADKDVQDVAKQLRKAADLLDPPNKQQNKPAKSGAIPSAADLTEAIPSDWPDDLFEATKQWAAYKQGRAKGERIQSMSAWAIALKQIWSKAEANGVDVVVQKIEKAIANSWKGWDHGDKDDAKKTAGKTGRIKPSSAVPPIEYR